ncbi:MAG: AmmeMemoRadiSam system radical SAM enzyme [Methanomassiliicoccaceae archaeon]|jgi:pyruvate formate lyase activating enzyme|nr:AmmeMemoRadiSam system radical SAM enzyme [Methanomassiliicoccaceae archaeon]
MSISPRIEARFYERDGNVYKCGLCPLGCRIAVGQFGRCGARRADEDMLVAYSYGKVSSLCVDPIEKKPLYHFHPGGRVFSVGGIGCNFSCRHCQNYSISQSATGKKRTTYESPEELVEMFRKERVDMFAFTYNEPSIWYEYMMDVMDCAPDATYVLVTNGYISDGPLRELCKRVSAMNIDVKAFTDEFYVKVCGGHLEPVLDAVRTAFSLGVHVELTYLLIPGYNDSDPEIQNFVNWILNDLSADVPVHFTRFHPDNAMNNVPWTSPESLLRAMDMAADMGLTNVYVGNIISEEGCDTYCPECGAVVIRRTGYLVNIVALEGLRCRGCGHRLYMIR